MPYIDMMVYTSSFDAYAHLYTCMMYIDFSEDSYDLMSAKPVRRWLWIVISDKVKDQEIPRNPPKNRFLDAWSETS